MKIDKKRPYLQAGITILAVITISVSGYYLYSYNHARANTQHNITGAPVKKVTLVSAKSRILIVGDVFWGRLYEQKRLKNEPGALQFPFSGLNTYDKTKYNSWIADLECPVTDRNIDFQTQWDAIALNCRPEFLNDFGKWFEVASLANNHTYDIDKEVGYQSTTEYLKKVNIQYFGHYLASQHDKACKVVNLGIDLTFSDNSTKKSKFPVAMCGYHGVISIPTAEDIAVINQYADKYLTIAMPHMGVEYQPKADQIKTSTYRSLVDAGADLVAGGHPHWVQNTEVYKNKLIVYSMGNFIFDQQGSAEVQRSVAVDATFQFSTPEQISMLTKWLQASDECTEDSCYKNMSGINKATSLPKITYDLAVGQQKGIVQAKSTDENVINQVLTRANWAKTKQQLGQE